jgi:hypothetical protein
VSASYASEVEGLTMLTLTDCRSKSRPISFMNVDLPSMQYEDDCPTPKITPKRSANQHISSHSNPSSLDGKEIETSAADSYFAAEDCDPPMGQSPDSMSSSIASLVVVDDSRAFNRPR